MVMKGEYRTDILAAGVGGWKLTVDEVESLCSTFHSFILPDLRLTNGCFELIVLFLDGYAAYMRLRRKSINVLTT